MTIQNCTNCHELIEDNQLIALADDGTLVHDSCVLVALEVLESTPTQNIACSNCCREITVYDETTLADSGDLVHAACLSKFA